MFKIKIYPPKAAHIHADNTDMVLLKRATQNQANYLHRKMKHLRDSHPQYRLPPGVTRQMQHPRFAKINRSFFFHIWMINVSTNIQSANITKHPTLLYGGLFTGFRKKHCSVSNKVERCFMVVVHNWQESHWRLPPTVSLMVNVTCDNFRKHLFCKSHTMTTLMGEVLQGWNTMHVSDRYPPVTVVLLGKLMAQGHLFRSGNTSQIVLTLALKHWEKGPRRHPPYPRTLFGLEPIPARTENSAK